MIHEILNDSIKYRSNELNAWLEKVTVILWYLYTWYIANAAQFLDLWLQYLSNQPNTCWIDGIQPLQVKHIEYRIEWSNTGCIRLMLGEWIEYRSFDIIWSIQAVSCSSSYNVTFKQTLIHSTCTWLLQPVHDWFDLYWIYYSSNWSAFAIYQV